MSQKRLRIISIILMFSLSELMSSIVFVSKVNSRPDWDCVLSWVVDVDMNGSAYVKMSIQMPLKRRINVTIPKTAQRIGIVGIKYYRFVEVEDGFLGVNLLELTPLEGTHGMLSLEYYWPDAAIPFNSTFYFGASEKPRLTPENTWSYSNITILLPENSTLVKFPESYRTSIKNGRRILTYEVRGQNVSGYWSQPGIVEFSYITPSCRGETVTLQSEHIEISTPPSLEPWSRVLLGYAENAYSILNSLIDTRFSRRGRLKIYLAPRLYIEERKNAGAFYVSSEDSIYYPSLYVFPASSGVRFWEL